ncbi:MAG TPA: hypothetical protein VF595_16415 [Tepidisphaeraceae bacterium]
MAAARGEVDRARTTLRAAVEKVRSTWKANPQMIAATDEAAAARKEYEAARRAVVEQLKSDPAYQSATKDQTDVQAKLRDEQAKTNAANPPTTKPEGTDETVKNLPAPSDQQVAVALDKLESKTKLRNLEDIAVAKDPTASKAQARLNEAEKALKVWQAQLDAALKNDPDYRGALDQMTAARSRMAAAAGTPNTDTYNNYGEVINVP